MLRQRRNRYMTERHIFWQIALIFRGVLLVKSFDGSNLVLFGSLLHFCVDSDSSWTVTSHPWFVEGLGS